MIIQVRFSAAQTGIGYQFYDDAGTLLSTRITAGIASGPETGSYIDDATVPATAVGVFWDSTETPDGASEDLREALAIIDVVGNRSAGAYSITVTVTDGTDPLENATVRVTEGASTYTATTDASGNASFSLDDATYATTITKSGYQFTPTTRTVTGEETGTLTDDLAMTAVSIPAPPADATMSTVYAYTENIINVASSGIALIFKATSSPVKSEKILEVASKTATTDADGLASIEIQRNIQYRVTCPVLGLNHLFTPTTDTFDLITLI